MQGERHFPPFRLDERTGRLRSGERSLDLRPKTFALLSYLVARAGQLVSKRELLSALWPGVTVGEAALTVCVHELRDALGDDSRSPRFIETAHGRGYRFIAPLGWSSSASSSLASSREGYEIFVGRSLEIDRLDESWHRALKGARQIVFITGEPGIGKTTLIDRFLGGLDQSQSALIGRGQCIELHGEGEAYLPVLEALGRMCRAPGGEELRQVLRSHAPGWLAEMPGLLEPAELQTARIEAASATQARMLRQVAEALELFTAVRPAILVFEDLHLGDHYTLELLDYFARRRGEARLLIVATARSSEARLQARTLDDIVRELRSHQQCELLQLEALSEAAVAEYLRRRIGSDRVPLELAAWVYRRTEGNALFMVTLVEHLLARAGAVDELDRVGIPESVRQMIEKQLDALLPDDERLLEAASVAGVEFSAAVLASALADGGGSENLDGWEERCEQLARRSRFLREAGIDQWPDGTISARYSFPHGLYQEVIYQRVSPARRSRLHRQIGDRMEAQYGARAGEIAAELAVHFEKGGDYERAVRYLTISAETSLHRSANDAAIAHAEKGLALLAVLPSSAERMGSELQLLFHLGSALMARWGMAAPRVERVYSRARELVNCLGACPTRIPALLGAAKFHITRSELDEAQVLAEESLQLANEAGDAELLLEAHLVTGAILYSRGRFRDSLTHCERAERVYDPAKHRSHALLYAIEPGVLAQNYAAMNLWRIGCADQARKRAAVAVALGESSGHAHSLSMALTALTSIHASCRDWRSAEVWADKLVCYAGEKGLEFWRAWGEVHRGRALAERGYFEEGVELIRSGLSSLKATGGSARQAEIASLPCQVRARAMKPEQALQIAEAALVTARETGELTDEAELRRIIGGFKLDDKPSRTSAAAEGEAERCFLDAIETARRQGALAFELRAVLDLARLWARRGDRVKARSRLLDSYCQFKEGFDTGDLKEAKALIDKLAG